jgi:hypothetical protein
MKLSLSPSFSLSLTHSCPSPPSAPIPAYPTARHQVKNRTENRSASEQTHVSSRRMHGIVLCCTRYWIFWPSRPFIFPNIYSLSATPDVKEFVKKKIHLIWSRTFDRAGTHIYIYIHTYIVRYSPLLLYRWAGLWSLAEFLPFCSPADYVTFYTGHPP